MKKTSAFDSLFSNVFAGAVSGIMTVIASISYATLIFSGECAGYLELGIASALLSATVIGLVVSLRSTSQFVIAGPDANISAIVGLMATAIAAQSRSESALFTALWISLALSCLLSGAFLFGVGRFGLGRWIRFVPYPVVGGFLAGTGWLLARGSFKVMCGVPLSFKTIRALGSIETLVHWLPGALFAIALLAILRRFRHVLILPGILIAAIIATHVVLAVCGITVEKAMADGWLLSPFPSKLLFETFGRLSLAGLDLSLLGSTVFHLGALMIVAAIVILLNSASVELATGKDVDLDRELTVTGVANMLASPLGSLTGCIALSRTILNYKAGARGRIAGVVSALLCGVLLVFAAPLLSLFPRPVLGGLLFYIGLSLLVEWVYDGWRRLSRLDYFLVVGIIVIIAAWGFLPGVGLGLLVACVLFAINYSRLGMIKHVYSGARYRSNVDRSLVEEKCLREKGDSIYIVQLQGYIFFGSAYPLLLRVQERLQARDLPAVRYVILDFAAVNGLDSSSVLSFSKLKKAARLHDATILAVNLLDSLAKLLVKGGVVDEAGARDGSSPCCFRSEDLDHALAWCEERLVEEAGLADEGQKRRFADHFGTYFPTAQSIERLMPYLERVEAAPSDVLFRQGTPSTDLYFVESGTVTTLLEISGQPAHKRLRTMGAGTVVGEMGLYLGRERTATVKAESRCVLYRLSSEALARLERDDVELASALHRFFVRLLSERLLHADEEIAHLVS